ncbi:MAG: amidohydrolase [Bacteroidales bacterium]|nr:amidohydrolase [Bacteroidales bacterium]
MFHNVYIDGVLSDIEVENGIITNIIPTAGTSAEPLSFAIPAFANLHTHSAMTLLRSCGSGLPLFRWLNDAIFPREAQLTAETIYQGALDACDEMRNTGTSAFNDMYFHVESTIRAAVERGLEANIALSVTDGDFENGNLKSFIERYETLSHSIEPGRNITVSIAPHAIYTVSGKHLQYLADFAQEHDTLFHIHLSETQKEREDCEKLYGVPPVIYLDQLGILDKTGSRFIGAHALWLDNTEIKILGEHRANVVHCPNSNLKLGSGFRFLYTELRDAGVNVTLGTDGCASSDNLDMVEAMKIMSLLQKGTRNDPSVLPAEEVLQVATANGRKALRLPDNSIKKGNVANFSIIRLDNPVFKGVDLHSSPDKLHSELLNRLVYAAHGNAISQTIIQRKQ